MLGGRLAITQLSLGVTYVVCGGSTEVKLKMKLSQLQNTSPPADEKLSKKLKTGSEQSQCPPVLGSLVALFSRSELYQV